MSTKKKKHASFGKHDSTLMNQGSASLTLWPPLMNDNDNDNDIPSFFLYFFGCAAFISAFSFFFLAFSSIKVFFFWLYHTSNACGENPLRRRKTLIIVACSIRRSSCKSSLRIARLRAKATFPWWLTCCTTDARSLLAWWKLTMDLFGRKLRGLRPLEV
jgi:hypothetical protein